MKSNPHIGRRATLGAMLATAAGLAASRAVPALAQTNAADKAAPRSPAAAAPWWCAAGSTPPSGSASSPGTG